MPQEYLEECRRRGVEHPLDAWETLNLESYLCPCCGATDRDRLQVLFLEGYLPQWRKGRQSRQRPCHVLEIAPSRPVAAWIRRQTEWEYRSADLVREDVDDRIDVTEMSCYLDGSFDVVICSHVLEHVSDDLKAKIGRAHV